MEELAENQQIISWNAPEYEHYKHTNEWFLKLWIIAISATVATFILKNFTFGIFIIIATGVITILAKRPPRTLEVSISDEALRFGPNRYYFDQIDGFFIEKITDTDGKILLKFKHSFMPLLTIPIQNIELQTIDAKLAKHLPRKKLEESLLEKIAHYFGI